MTAPAVPDLAAAEAVAVLMTGVSEGTWFRRQLSPPAPDACPHRSFGAAMPVIGVRSLALDHGTVYRHRGTAQNHPWAVYPLVAARRRRIAAVPVVLSRSGRRAGRAP